MEFTGFRVYEYSDVAGDTYAPGTVGLIGEFTLDMGKKVYTDPNQPVVMGQSVEDLRTTVAQMAAGLAGDVLHFSDVVGHPDYVDPETVGESDNSTEATEPPPDPSDPGPSEPPTGVDVEDVVDNGGEGEGEPDLSFDATPEPPEHLSEPSTVEVDELGSPIYDPSFDDAIHPDEEG